MKIDFKKVSNEQGRSIIEMIAVVVIISVLTVLCAASYWYVMNRYKANALTSELSSMALATSIKLSQPSPNIQFQGNVDYPYEGKLNDNRTFTITVSNVPWGVCRMLKTNDWSLPYETKINGNLGGACLDENKFAFSFHNSLYDGAHPNLPSGEETEEPTEPTKDYCRPACLKGCKETCKTKKYWCWSDDCACFNGKANPPFCDKDTPCSVEYVSITNCDKEETLCCPDFEICEPPDCEGS